MNVHPKLAAVLLLGLLTAGRADEGETLFKAYCWGCHHPTVEAFGPSFRTIADHRSREQVIAQIADPEHTYRSLGYARNSMPAFGDLNTSALNALADYIFRFKDTP